MAKSIQDVLSDPSFAQLAPEVQRSILGKMGVSSEFSDRILMRFTVHADDSDAARRFDAYLKSGKPTSAKREPGKGAPASFLTRMSERIGGNVKASVDLPGVQRQLEEGRKQRPPGGYVFSPEGRKKLLEPFVQAYKDPANIAGDVSTALLFRSAEAPVERPSTATATGSATGIAPSAEPTLTPDQLTKWSESLDKANREHAEALTDYAEKESQRRAQWAEKAYQSGQAGVGGSPERIPTGSAAEAEAAAHKKQILDRGSEEYARLAHRNILDTHQTVRARLDSRWNDFRTKMGSATVAKNELYGVIEEAREKLRGSPADIKQFNDLMREMGIEVDEAGEITVPEGVSPDLPVDTARVHSSAIGDRLAQGDLPGNIYQSLKTAKEGIEGIIETEAESRGLGDVYRQLKADWSQYMRDWNDLRAVSTGKGSVLARARRAPNGAFLRGLLLGKGGDLLLEDLGKYRSAGARPELGQHARNLLTKSRGIKAGPVRAMPPDYQPLPEPKLKEVPRPTPAAPKAVKAPAKVKAPPLARSAARMAGGLTMSVPGALVGHPFAGYHLGSDIGASIADRIYQRRSGLAVPPDLERPRNND